jgi:hypothetical protein
MYISLLCLIIVFIIFLDYYLLMKIFNINKEYILDIILLCTNKMHFVQIVSLIGC